ncbi:MAG: ribbon-helix-helix domain-containing protein [Opitutae bacterium]
MKRAYTLHIEVEQIDELKRLSVATGVPASEMIRRGIDLYLRQTKLVDSRVVWQAAAVDEVADE